MATRLRRTTKALVARQVAARGGYKERVGPELVLHIQHRAKEPHGIQIQTPCDCD